MEDIKTLIETPDLLNQDTAKELKSIVEKYPYFQTARILYLKNIFQEHSPQFGTELRRSSVLVADRSVLFNITEAQNYQLEGVRTAKPGIEVDDNRTISLIDSFLSGVHTKDNDEKRAPSLADLTTDYASFLTNMDDIETTPELKGADLIDSFIAETKGKQRVEIGDYDLSDLSDSNTANDPYQFKSPELTDEDEEIYTENMVNIYIKQGRYEQALEILRKICVNNPKKSVNFASQMKLLEVIVAN